LYAEVLFLALETTFKAEWRWPLHAMWRHGGHKFINVTRILIFSTW